MAQQAAAAGAGVLAEQIDPADDGAGQSVVLEEQIDPDYEPSEAEVREYAAWLGMDPEGEQELLYIAREGLRAPLPENWKPCRSPDGEIYYFNFSNGESVWDHPCDERYKEMYQTEKERLRLLFAMRVSKRLLALSCCLSERVGGSSVGWALPIELMECIADEVRRLPRTAVPPAARPRLPPSSDPTQRVSEGVPPTGFERLRSSPTQVATAALAAIFYKRKPELRMEPEPAPEPERAESAGPPATSGSYLALLEEVDSDCDAHLPSLPAESSSERTNVSSSAAEGAARELLGALSTAQKDALLLTVLRDYPEVAAQAQAAAALTAHHLASTTPT